MSPIKTSSVEPAHIAPPRALCVAIHDVAPATWSRCEFWLQAIRAVADIPVTLLVVPHYHRHRIHQPASFDALLTQRLSQGDELALHGYSHLDEGPSPTNCWNKIVRRIYTQGEAEFYAIDADDATQRIKNGLAWFERNQWPVTGFVAPAWLLGKGGWQALQNSPFQYTTTMQRFYLMPERISVPSASLVYSVRNSWLKTIFCAGNSLVYFTSQDTPLVRLGLHPNDALHPDVVKHTQKLIEKMLESRVAMTKMTFTKMWRQGMRPPVKTASALSANRNFAPEKTIRKTG